MLNVSQYYTHPIPIVAFIQSSFSFHSFFFFPLLISVFLFLDLLNFSKCEHCQETEIQATSKQP